jgi:hypothetical protein
MGGKTNLILDQNNKLITGNSPKLQIPPFKASGVENKQYNLDINAIRLNPLQNKFEDNKHPHHSGPGAGHAIDIVGRGSGIPESGIITNLYKPDDEKRYSEDYRFLGIRGPIILHSWGYDTEGKPIPNETTTTASGDQVIGNTDRFSKDWLQKPSTWPAGPIDLRFDRARGVWVSPPPYKILRAQIIQEIPPFGEGKGQILGDGENLYNQDGQEIFFTQTVSSGNEDGGNVCSTNWVDVITNICLTQQGLVIQKKKVLVVDTGDFSCKESFISTTNCETSGNPVPSGSGLPQYGETVCACTGLPEASGSKSINESTITGLITIKDYIGRRYKVGCIVLVYYNINRLEYTVIHS